MSERRSFKSGKPVTHDRIGHEVSGASLRASQKVKYNVLSLVTMAAAHAFKTANATTPQPTRFFTRGVIITSHDVAIPLITHDATAVRNTAATVEASASNFRDQTPIHA